MTVILSALFSSELKWHCHCKNDSNLLHSFNETPPSSTGLLDRVPPHLQDMYKSAFRIANTGCYKRRVVVTTKGRETHWINWCSFVESLGVNSNLQDAEYQERVRDLTGLACLSSTGFYGRRREIQSNRVSGAITAIRKKISMTHEVNPIK